MVSSFDLSLVLLSIVVAVSASYVVLDVGSRITRAAPHVRTMWTTITALSLGGGIWSAHFIGVLALDLPVPIRYSVTALLASFAGTVGIATLTLTQLARSTTHRSPEVIRRALLWSAVAMGTIVSAMDFITLSAARGSFAISYHLPAAAMATGLSIMVSYFTLLMVANATDRPAQRWIDRRYLCSALAVGLATIGAHRVIIHSIVFTPVAETPEQLTILATSGLAIATTFLTLGALMAAVVTAVITRRFEAHETALLQEKTLRVQSEAIEEILQRQTMELDNANQAKIDFLATMSHELRTPLNAIAGYTELLLLGLRGSLTEGQREDLTRIQRSQRHLLTLINDVLSFAKVDAGTVQYIYEDVLLSGVIDNAVMFVEPQLRNKGLKYELLPPNEEIFVYADEDKLTQILINLLSNAIKFTDTTGSVTIGWVRDSTDAIISVTDTGIGIPENKLLTVFEPFFQINQSLTRQHQGIGLGLPISWDLAKAMHGELSVSSTVGQGSTFTVRIPLGSQHLTPEQWEQRTEKRRVIQAARDAMTRTRYRRTPATPFRPRMVTADDGPVD